MKKSAAVAVVLVHYEDYALKYFERCHQSLKAQSFPADEFTLFVVSNGAFPEADSFVRRISPEARHLSNEKNEGWARANNAAVRAALDEGFECIVLLNMDTELDKDWLHHLVRSARERGSGEIIQSKILLHGTNRINSVGNRIHFLGYGYCLGYGKADVNYKNDSHLDFASGASMLVKAEVFRRIGLFDEEYFLYYDDLEFGWRARLAGFRITLEPSSICYHKYDFSGKIKFLFHLEKNRLLAMMTLTKKRTFLLLFPALAVTQFISGLYFSCKGHFWDIASVYGHLTKKKTREYITSKRADIRKIRIHSDASIVRKFSPYFFFAEIQRHRRIKFINSVLSFYWKMVRSFIT